MASIAFDVKITDAFGYFYNYEKALQEIQSFQRETGTYFCQAWSHIKESLHPEIKPGAHKIFWNDGENSRVKKCQLDFDGIPYIVLGSRIYDCQYGVDRNLNHKRRYKEAQMKGDNIFRKRYHRIQATKKQDCPAQIYLREIVKFPDFRIISNTEYYRRKSSARVQNALKSGNVCGEKRTYVHFPYISDHKNHSLEEVRGLKHPIDSRLKKKIHELVADGITDVKTLKSILCQFVQTELFAGKDLPSKSNRHFYPKKSDIQNCINLASIKLKISQSDQEYVETKIQEWQQSQPEDKFFFRPYADVKDESSFHSPNCGQQLLVVHQTKWQRQLLEWYGQDLCLLDGTYKTSENSLPLFFLVVKTSIDFQVAGSFIVQSETAAAVKEALGVFRLWNPKWKPFLFMSDLSDIEITAIEQTFEDVTVLLCDYQREQAWERWALNTDNGVTAVKEEALSYLRRIAQTNSVQEFSEAEKDLFSSDIWIKNRKLQKWFGKFWLPEHQKWVWAYRKDHLLDHFNTYNGIEQLNETFKYYHLKSQDQNALSGMLCILVEYFLPDLYTKYLQDTSGEDLETSIPAESPAYEEPEENFASKCRELVDQIRSYTYLLEDQLALRELYESLLIAYDTVLEHTKGKRGILSNQTTKVTKKSSFRPLKEKQFPSVPVEEKACIVPESIEVIASVDEDNKFGDLIVGPEWTQPQNGNVESYITYDSVLEPSLCEKQVPLKKENSETKPVKKVHKKSYQSKSGTKETNSVKVWVGEKACLTPGVFQVLVPVEENNKLGDLEIHVEETPSVIPETYQILIPVEEKSKAGELVAGTDWTFSQSGDVASYVTVSDTCIKKRKQEGKDVTHNCKRKS